MAEVTRRQAQAVVTALRDLGGVGHLSEITKQCAIAGPGEPKDSIRRVLQEFSTDSDLKEYTPPQDLFYSVFGVKAKRGFWGLRGFSAQAPQLYPITDLKRAHATLLRRDETPLYNVRGIAYRDGLVHAVQVGFAQGSSYPDQLRIDGSILHVGEGLGREQTETGGNAGMLDAIARGYLIPVYLATGPTNRRMYARLGMYRVVDASRKIIRLENNDFDTNALVFVLEPESRAIAQSTAASVPIVSFLPATAVDEADHDSTPSETEIPDEAPNPPQPGDFASDPEARLQALQNANDSHHALVLFVKRKARAAQLHCTRTKYADALVRASNFGSIFEMKSVRNDLIRQLRAAIAQLYHYRFLHRRTHGFEHGVHLYAVFDTKLPDELRDFLREIGIGSISIVSGSAFADSETREELPWLISESSTG